MSRTGEVLEFDRSVVSGFQRVAYLCPYCHTSNGCVAFTMWAAALSPESYSLLADKGWCRSGKMIYLPINSRCCCPQLSTRVDALSFEPTKKQKKVFRRLGNTRHSTGNTRKSARKVMQSNEDERTQSIRKVIGEILLEICGDLGLSEFVPSSFREHPELLVDKTNNAPTQYSAQTQMHFAAPIAIVLKGRMQKFGMTSGKCPVYQNSDELAALFAQRFANKSSTILVQNISSGYLNFACNLEANQNSSIESELSSQSRTMEDDQKTDDHIYPDVVISLERPHYSDELFDLYLRYQARVHGDSTSTLTQKHFKDFLIDTPLSESPFVIPQNSSFPFKIQNVNSFGLGTYHCYYRLKERNNLNQEGKLLAMSLIDILPNCVNSLYFIWDPDFKFMSLGTFSALKEIELVRSLHEIYPDFLYYFLGYYVLTNPKMQYKLNYRPSTMFWDSFGTWIDSSEAVNLLEKKSPIIPRQNSDLGELDIPVFLEILLCIDGEIITFGDARETLATLLSSEDMESLISTLDTYLHNVGTEFTKKVAYFVSVEARRNE